MHGSQSLGNRRKNRKNRGTPIKSISILNSKECMKKVHEKAHENVHENVHEDVHERHMKRRMKES